MREEEPKADRFREAISRQTLDYRRNAPDLERQAVTLHGRQSRKTVSFMPLQRSSYAAVAQWIEYWPPKPRVVGSIPASRTN